MAVKKKKTVEHLVTNLCNKLKFILFYFIDYHVPYEYLTNTTIRDKLAPVKLNRYKDDVLFYMFYTNVGDVLQLAAAAEL